MPAQLQSAMSRDAGRGVPHLLPSTFATPIQDTGLRQCVSRRYMQRVDVSQSEILRLGSSVVSSDLSRLETVIAGDVGNFGADMLSHDVCFIGGLAGSEQRATCRCGCSNGGRNHALTQTRQDGHQCAVGPDTMASGGVMGPCSSMSKGARA